VQFPTPQNILSDPLIIRVRATFFSEEGKEATPATVIGYHQLRVRVSDKAHVPLLARYRAIDERNAQLIEEVQRTMPQLNVEHLNDFVEVLGAITNYMGVSLQQALYREGLVVYETDFQKNLLYHLRTWLGEEVREAPKQGGGPTDIQYKSVTVELKVEKEISDRRKIIEKYLSQTTQYSSANGAQLGILCVLDLTEKDKPPANPQNQITLETPEVHGFDSTLEFPTKIAAVIIDGNLRLPSSYSH
jgi:predicted house-cleaning noncanonical NTP pyrophosphatase (MazG superfamily)